MVAVASALRCCLWWFGSSHDGNGGGGGGGGACIRVSGIDVYVSSRIYRP